ncbi:MAG TPA: beta-galactosidase [Terriglobia bacterium]|nr:beta-galactosidase [Terriglobia bacterium]
MRHLLWIVLLTCCLEVPLPAQLPAPKSTGPDFLPMAVWYGGGKARAPMLESNPREKREIWKADLLSIRKLGFNTVRCWIDWASAEPVENQFNLDSLDVLTELAQEVGLRVLVQVYMDSAPDWVGRKFPDSQFVDISGAKMRSESAPGFCFDHPGVRKAMLGFFTRLALEVKNRPAFLGWDLWSEPHVINWASATYLPSPEFCFCPYTTARFREWLKKKYSTLGALNQAWYRRYESWESVEPPRLSTILSYTDYTDWRYFILDKLAEDLRARYEAVKAVLPDRVATSHAAAPSLFTHPLDGDGNPDDWLMAQQVDYWGTSFYPKHSFPVGRDPAWRGALLDFSRSACYSKANGFWIGELQGGFGTVALNISSTVTSDDVAIWMWSALARGAKAINIYAWYPMSSGYESGGFGLINLDGSITERARKAGGISRTVDQAQQLFLKAQPAAAAVAIVYNPLSYMVGGRQPSWAAGAQSEFEGIERNSMLGMYRALFPSNIPVDFIHINQIPENAGQYKLILLPYPLMIPEASARALKEYVRNGGTLVTEARLAWNDEHGWAKEIIPGFGLHEIVGCRETSIQRTANGKTSIEIVTVDPSIPGLRTGDRLEGGLYEEALEPLSAGAKVIAKFPNGSAAMVVSSFGKGKSLAVGTFLGMSYEAHRDSKLKEFFNGLLSWAGISPRVRVTVASGQPSVEIREMTSGKETLLFVFNHETSSVEAFVRFKQPGGGCDASDLQTGEKVSFIREGEELVFKKPMASSQVWVIRITPNG